MDTILFTTNDCYETHRLGLFYGTVKRMSFRPLSSSNNLVIAFELEGGQQVEYSITLDSSGAERLNRLLSAIPKADDDCEVHLLGAIYEIYVDAKWDDQAVWLEVADVECFAGFDSRTKTKPILCPL